MVERADAPEFSRMIIADRVTPGGSVEKIEAGEAERRALAERMELEAIDRLSAVVRLKRVRGGKMIQVTGELEADVVQTCGVTLESVPARVVDRFGALFAPPELLPAPEDEAEMLMDPAVAEEDIPEALVNGRIDIGELTAQHLSLALDPYPRAPGVAFEGLDEHGEEDDDAASAEPATPNPFAALAKLKRPGQG